MQNRWKLLLDMDGVLANWVQATSDHHGIPNPYLKPENRGISDYKIVSGIATNAELFDGMETDFWTGIPPLPEAFELMDALESMFGDRIWICSSPSDNSHCITGKHAWIKNNFPKLRRKFNFCSNKEVCASPYSILVDDTQKKLDPFIADGGHGVLYPALWNSLHDIPQGNKVMYTVEKIAAILDENDQEMCRNGCCAPKSNQ